MKSNFPVPALLLAALSLTSMLAAAQSGAPVAPTPTPAERGVLADPGNGPFLPPDIKPRPRPQLKPRMSSDELKLESRPELRPEMSPGMQPNTQKPLRPRNPAVVRDNLSQAPVTPVAPFVQTVPIVPVVIPVDPRDSTSRPASLPATDPQRDVTIPGTAASAPFGTASAPARP